MHYRAFILIVFFSIVSTHLVAQFSAKWLKSIGGKYGEVWENSTIDTEGNCYISGWFQSDTCWFGESHFLLKQSGEQNNFLVKINSYGQTEWVHHIFTKLYVFGVAALETDSDGNVYLGASYYSDSMSIAGEMILHKPVEHASSIFILKFSSTGQLINQKQWFGGANATCKSIDIDRENDGILMGGEYQFYYNFGSFNLNGDLNSSSVEPYIVKLSIDLNVDTAFSISGVGRRYATDVELCSNGNTILSGYFQNGYMIIEDDTLHNSSSKTDFYVLSFNEFMEPQWAQRSYAVDHERVTRILTDEHGNIFTTISFEGDSILLKDTIVYKDASQISFLVSKIDSKGEYIWIKNASFESSGIASDLTFIDSSSFVVSGSFDGEHMSIGSMEIYNSDSHKSEAFLFKLNRSNGNVVRGFSFGGFDDQSADKVHTTENGDYVFTGTYFSDSVKIADQVIYNKGNSDFYILKVKPDLVSINPILKEYDSMAIYPNPASQSITIKTNVKELKTVMIWNLNGKMLIKQDLPGEIVDISCLNSGIYFISIFQKDRRPFIQKLIIQ